MPQLTKQTRSMSADLPTTTPCATARDEYLSTVGLRAAKTNNARATLACNRPGCAAASQWASGRRAVLYRFNTTGNDADAMVRGTRLSCSFGCQPEWWDDHAAMCGWAHPEICIKVNGKTADRESARESRESDFRSSTKRKQKTTIVTKRRVRSRTGCQGQKSPSAKETVTPTSQS